MRNGTLWDVSVRESSATEMHSSIQAHGGWMLPVGDWFYWYGEDRRASGVGFRCYRSQDLVSWMDLGCVLAGGASEVMERPRVLRCPTTGKFVLWFHADTACYDWASLGVAVADAPEGPFQLREIARPSGEEARDFTLFQDPEGEAFLVYSSEGNSTLHCARLTKDYCAVEQGFIRQLVDQYRESPCVFSTKGQTYLVTSGCSGWRPNQALWATASSADGPWRLVGNPCVGRNDTASARTTFDGQISCVFKFHGRWIALVDHWYPDDLSRSGYSLLPVEFQHDKHHSLIIRWQDESASYGGTNNESCSFEKVRRPLRVMVLTDTANEADDQFALAHALLSLSFEVRGVIAEHFGNEGSVRASFDEAARVMDLVGPTSAAVPLLQGAPRPLNALLPAVHENLSQSLRGARAIVQEALRNDERPLYLLCLGPLTDVALALRLEPTVAEHVTVVWVGGGRYPSGSHEANLARDLKAAREVFSSGIPLWQIPSEAYKMLVVSAAELRVHVKPQGALGAYLAGELEEFRARYLGVKPWVLPESWVLGDEAAVGVLLANMKGCYEERPAPALLDDCDYGGPPDPKRTIRVYHTLNARFILADLYSKLALQK